MSKSLIPPVTDSSILSESLAILEQMGERLEESSNFLRTLAHSPAVLEAFEAQVSATARMKLQPRTQQAIALRVAELQGCGYCLAAHALEAERLGVDAAAARRYRQGLSNDPREQALLALATKVVLERGHHNGFVVETARQVGVSDEEIVEVIALVGLNTFANYLTSVANTALDDTAAGDL